MRQQEVVQRLMKACRQRFKHQQPRLERLEPTTDDNTEGYITISVRDVWRMPYKIVAEEDDRGGG